MAGAVNEHPQVQFYKDSAGEFRWRLVARNGETIADCSEGYSSRKACLEAYDRLVEYMTEKLIEIVREDSWKSKRRNRKT